MLYELVTVYDNRLQSLKSQIKLNEAVFGKRQGKWKKTIILSIRILRQCSALPDKEQFSEAFAVKTFSRQRLDWLSRKQHKCVGNN